MASVVEIKIVVDPTQAVSGVKQTQGAFDSFSMVMTRQEQDAARLAKTMDLTGISYDRTSESVSRSTGHMASNLDAVRLLSQEFGFRLPRALESMLSRMPGVTSALSGMLGGMVAIAGVEVFARVIQGAVEVYDKFFSLNSIIDKYNEKMEKARQADLPNTHDIETTQLRLATETHAAFASGADAKTQQTQATSEMLKGVYRNPAGIVGGLIQGGIDLYQARDTQEHATEAAEERDALQRKQLEDIHERVLAQIELNHAQDGTLTGKQKIAAEDRKQRELHQEDADSGYFAQKAYSNEVASDPGAMARRTMYAGETSAVAGTSNDAGATLQRLKDMTADRQAGAQGTELDRETSLAVMRADDAAAQARLQGEDLYRRKMQDDIRETTLELNNQGKAAEIPARIREINAKYFEDLSERAVKAQNESGLAIARASASGLTGAARIEADRWNTVNENNTKYAGDPERERAENVAAATEADNKLTELQQQFTERMKSLEEGRVDATLGGYARIQAEAAKTSASIAIDFNKSWGGSNQSSPQFLAAKKQEQDALAAVQQSAAQQMTEYQQKQDQETLRYDQQAAEAERRVRGVGLTGFIADYQNGLAEIRARDQEQTAQLQDELNKREIDEETFARRKQDVDREANAQIAAQNQQLQHQIAGDLEAAFTNPLDFIKRKMQEWLFEMVAQWLTHLKIFQSAYGSIMGSLGGPRATAAPGAAAAPGVGGIGLAIPGVRGLVGAHPTAPASVAAATTSVPGVSNGGLVIRNIGGSSAASADSVSPAYTAGGISIEGGYAPSSGGYAPSFGATSPAFSSGSYSSGAAPASSSTAPSAGGYTPHLPAYAEATHAGRGGAAATAQSIVGGSASLYNTVSAAHAQIQAQQAATGGPSGASVGSSSPSGGFSTGAGVPGSGDTSAAMVMPAGNDTGLATAAASDDPGIAATNVQATSTIPLQSQPSYKIPGVSPTKATGAMSTGLAIAGAGMAGYEGYQDTVSDFKSGSASGTMKGMLGDAMAGAAIGSLAGPLGTAIGAGIGAAVGLIAGVAGAIMGEGGNLAARDYYKKTLFPQIEAERNGDGASDFQSAISNVNRIASDGMEYMAKKWGGSAANWVDANYLKKEQDLADGELLARAKGGAQFVKMSAAQFHSGGVIGDFGDFGTSSDEGYIHARLGEAVMNPSAVSMHGSALDAMNGGASPSDMASMYLASSSSGGGGSTTHNHNYGGATIHALDSKSFDQYVSQPKQARSLVKALNKHSSQYAGDGVAG